MMHVLNNPQRLSRLLASLNVSGSNRPLSPVEVASEISAFRNDLGGDLKEVVNRLPVSADIVNEFLWLPKLPHKIQDVVVWGESSKKDGSIGFSVAAKMARFSNHEDILKIAGATLEMSRPVTKEEVKAILGLKKRVPSKPIDECMGEVLNATRRFTVNHFLFISRIKPSTAASLASNKSGQSLHDEVLIALKSSFPLGTLKNIKVSNERVRLALDEEGWNFIATYCKRHRLARQEVVNHMLESTGFANDRQ